MVVKLVVLPAGKSKTWQHFGFKVDSGKRLLVWQKYVWEIAGNMMKLMHHLNQYHEKEYALL